MCQDYGRKFFRAEFFVDSFADRLLYLMCNKCHKFMICFVCTIIITKRLYIKYFILGNMT